MFLASETAGLELNCYREYIFGMNVTLKLNDASTQTVLHCRDSSQQHRVRLCAHSETSQ